MDLALYLGLSLAISIVYIFAVNFNIAKLASHWFLFLNPIVILSSVYLFLFFSKVRFTSTVINYLAQSAFAVYLLHLNTKVWDSFRYRCYELFTLGGEGYQFLRVILVILEVFIIALLFDQVRILCWKPIERRIERR